MRKEFLTFCAPLISQPEIDEVVATLKSGWIGTGPKTHRFEEEFRKYKDVHHAVALNSCTAALHLALISIGLKRGDEVIVPTMTFTATASQIIHAGGKPVFVDCNRQTMNIDPADIMKKITKRTRAIMVVHFAGRPCDMDEIMAIAADNNLLVIEDCAHAIETEYYGKKAGTIGDIGCFSFYATKNLTTSEGGMAITNSEAYEKKIRTLSLHGMSRDAWQRFGHKGYQQYDIVDAGYKYNMTDIQASLGIHQLANIEENSKYRNTIWNQYNSALRGFPVIIPADTPPGMRHAHHLYTSLLDIDRLSITRDQFLDEMTKRNIGTGVHYRALHLHPYYQRELGYHIGDFPNAEFISDRTVSLPISPSMSSDDVSDVIDAVQTVLNIYRKQ